MLVKDINEKLKNGYLIIYENDASPKKTAEEFDDVKMISSSKTIEDETLLNREVKCIEPFDDVFIKVVVN